LFALMLIAQPAPGPASDYWQQDVHYTIEASLDEERGTLTGAATMVYHNRSPDALGELYFHLHLNAFRPASLWAVVETRPSLQFGTLRDPDYGYERLRTMTSEGLPLRLSYPHAPDSTVVRADLSRPVAPGDSVVVRMEWEARLSTMCRRQCRRGRHYDFAHWYPRIAVYDSGGWQPHPLRPQGEFYGEFGTYDVTLDLPVDQVVGATGVVLDGDPGWRATRDSPAEPADLTGFYPLPREPRSPRLLSSEVDPGRKRVRLYAEDVHHFAWSTDPRYLYEGGRHGEVAINVLFLPGDVDWDLGSVVRRTARALGWLEGTFGPYPWPQLTIVHRLDGGGTEFPMFIGNGDAGQSLIMHETAHQYAHGILANNEWRDPWLDEGMATFLNSWFMEENGLLDAWSSRVQQVAEVEAIGLGMPIDTLSDAMPNFPTYSHLAYGKPAVMYRMLREYLGWDTFREGLRTYYERKKLQHVTEDDLKRSMEDVSGQDLGWFFDQWLRTTATLDYRLGEVTVSQDLEGRWVTELEVIRDGDAWMPVILLVGDHWEVLTGSDAVQTVTVTTSDPPGFAALDPWFVLPDTDRATNWRDLP
jgi:hypothetical protein